MKKVWFGLAIGVAFLLSSGPAGASAYIETFNAGSAGWENGTISFPSGGVSETASSWSSTGGNPGGYIYGGVPATNTGTAFYGFDGASDVANFGNLTGLVLTTDFKTLGTGLVNTAGPTPFARFFIGSGTTYYVSDDAFSWNPNNDTSWTTYQVAVNAADFILWPIDSGPLTFAQVIADPTDIGIIFTGSAANITALGYTGLGINGTTTTTIELDNFGTTAVPEPGILLLLAPGLFGVGLFSKMRLAKK